MPHQSGIGNAMAIGRSEDANARRPRLYLVSPALEDPRAFGAALSDAFGAADFAALLLRLAPSDERTKINRIKALAPAVQKAEAALILDGHPELVAKSGADGAHLSGVDAFMEAVEQLKPDWIAGAGGLFTRHDAMLAAEKNADYVMIGDPHGRGHRQPFDDVLDRVSWWAEVFQVPCVAYAARLEEVAPLAQAGADFIALGDFVFADPDRIAANVTAAMQQLATTDALA
jgi:thiamine-phosphate pyrophosphorylase